MFISEILFFSFFFDFNPQMCFLYIVLLYLIGPTMFFRSWLLVLFGQSTHLSRTIPVDLLSRELIVYGGLIFLMIWLGLSWQSFLF
jgi:NADH:ubiquinone oxidoreductase subunit 4 (subunit M)